MTAGIKANNDGSAAIQVGGTDYITISSAGAVAIPVSLTVGGIPAGGDYIMNAYTSPTTWSKPTGLKAIKVTVVGAGGDGGQVSGATAPTTASGGGGGGGGGATVYYDAPTIPGPITITAGAGTNSFGSLVSATAGANAPSVVAPNIGTGGAGGTASISSPAPVGSVSSTGGRGQGSSGGIGGVGANGLFGLGMGGVNRTSPIDGVGAGFAATGYGAGGGGAAKNNPNTATYAGGAGVPGIVIVEEFY